MVGQDSPTDALFLSVRAGDVEAVAKALDEGASLSNRDGDDWSALHWAAGRGGEAIVTLLLERGADPTSVGAEGRTPYQIALAAGHLDAARILRNAEEIADPASMEAHVWRPYCKAYLLAQLRSAPMWSDDASELAEDAIVYLHDDYTVTRSIWKGEDVLHSVVTPQWIAHCHDVLAFHIPDDFELAPPAQAQSIGSS